MTLFKELTDEEKVEQVTHHNVRSSELITDDSISIDSTMPGYEEMNNVKFVEIVKCAFKQWRYMSVNSREAWNRRADKLNAKKLPGWVMNLPKKITNSVVMKSISLEWELLVKAFKEAVEREPPKEQKNVTYQFGNETVTMKSQTYKKFTMTLLLKVYLFGEDYEKVRSEVVYQSKKLTLLHFASQKRLSTVLTVEEQSATQFLYEKGVFQAIRTCCGKVQIANSAGDKNVGFILEERRNVWKIKLKGTNEIVNLKKLTFNSETQQYQFNDHKHYMGRYITTYWPIRILLSNTGLCRMAINQVKFVKLNDKIIELPLFTN